MIYDPLRGLTLLDLFAIEFEIRTEGPLLTELLEGPLFGPVTGHYRQTIAPLGFLCLLANRGKPV